MQNSCKFVHELSNRVYVKACSRVIKQLIRESLPGVMQTGKKVGLYKIMIAN